MDGECRCHHQYPQPLLANWRSIVLEDSTSRTRDRISVENEEVLSEAIVEVGSEVGSEAIEEAIEEVIEEVGLEAVAAVALEVIEVAALEVIAGPAALEVIEVVVSEAIAVAVLEVIADLAALATGVVGEILSAGATEVEMHPAEVVIEVALEAAGDEMVIECIEW